jgi:hypothetical protein
MPIARASVVMLVCLGLVPAQPPNRPGEPPRTSAAPSNAEVQFADGSTLKLKVLDETIDLVTPYGPLKIPVRVIRKIDFGMRLTDAEVKEIEAAVADLTGTNPAKRETAKARLGGFGEKAVPALRRAARGANEDALAHIETVLDKLAANRAGADVRDHDMVFTEDSQIAGRLPATSVRVMTAQFGEQRLKFEGVKLIYGPVAEAATDVAGVTDAPGSMMTFQNRHGTVLHLRVTGAIGGTLWGTGTYTLDSHLPMAVVHAGVLQVGQTGVVKVRIIPSPANYVGSTQNGVASSNYAAFPAGAFEIISGGRR